MTKSRRAFLRAMLVSLGLLMAPAVGVIRSKTIRTTITFPPAPADWGRVTHVRIYDSPFDGKCVAELEL